MRTNIDLDDELIDEARRLTGLATKKDLVNHALRELIARERRKAVLALEGKLHWEGDLDAMRQGRFLDNDSPEAKA